MSASLRWRLSLMMFLQFAVWGAWAPVLGSYMTDTLKFSGAEGGAVYGMLPLASIFAPMIFGQIADRYVPTQWLLAGLHLLGAALLWWLGSLTDYQAFLWGMLAFSLAYAPTMVLTNSLSFSHLQSSDKEFGGIRVWGTLGWMAAGYTLTGWLHYSNQTSQGDCLRVAAIFALLLGLFCFALPNTPPRREGADPWAFLKALALLQNRNFLIFMVISFVVATELQFYYLLTAPFLQDLGVSSQNTPAVLTIAQAAELIVMGFLLPWLLPRWGVRKVMVVGILAWPIRYAIFAVAAAVGNSMLPLAEAALTLHGLCYVFFFVVGFIYVDMVAPTDIRASAQSLIGVVTLGAGLCLGSYIAGAIKDAFTRHSQIAGGHDVVNWSMVFLIPCVLTVLCAIIFPLIFKSDGYGSVEVSGEGVKG